MIMPARWTRSDLEKHSVDLRQFIDFRQATLPDGVRLVEVYNASGLHFTLLPDRGLDIWTAHYKGLPLTWIAQGSPHSPDYGSGWLRQFNGGLLTTCGLAHVGPPEHDPTSGEPRHIHGHYTRLRATITQNDGTWTDDSDVYAHTFAGRLSEASLFGTQFEITRSYTLPLNRPAVIIATTVTNRGDVPAPLMLLYHFNVGFPLVQQGARFLSPGALYPRDAAARTGLGTWSKYGPPTPAYAEQVFYHHPNALDVQTGFTSTALVQDDFGLRLDWSCREMPYLTQWKNTRQGLYVSGIEPGNCIPEGQNAARANQRLMLLPPGETQEFTCQLSVLDGREAVQQCQTMILQLQHSGIPATGCQLGDFV